MNPTRAYIDLNKLKYNIMNIRKKTGNNKKILMAVKANAYGHGAITISDFLQSNGLVDYLGVATSGEGLELRKNGINLPILKFSQCFEEEMIDIIKNDIEIASYSEDFINKLNQIANDLGKIAIIHLKIDTGMGRVGVLPKNIEKICNILKKCKNIKLKGIMTHFPSSDSRDKEFTKKQILLFKKCVEEIKSFGLDPEIIHAANSGAVIDHEEAYFDMVRPGIMCYGYYPSNETSQKISIEPIMSLVSKISYLKKVEKNTPISYGRTYHTFEKECYIATIPTGYGDGYNRSLSNRGKVCIKETEYKIAGRICMDQFMIDIGGNSPKLKTGDDVVLFGSFNKDSISLDYLCSLLNTINYEVLCNVAPRVERIYLNKDAD